MDDQKIPYKWLIFNLAMHQAHGKTVFFVAKSPLRWVFFRPEISRLPDTFILENRSSETPVNTSD